MPKKKWPVELTASAATDLSRIHAFILEGGNRAADQFLTQLTRGIQSLELHPERCPLIPENDLLGTEYRHLLIGRYRVIYRVFAMKVVIMRVVHDARDLTGVMQ